MADDGILTAFATPAAQSTWRPRHHENHDLAVLAFAARVFAYSAIRAPALAIAVEASHGLTFSLFLVASVDYVHRLVPSEWRATGQALLTASFFGAGGILGNTWAGFLYDRVGVQMMFRVNAGILLAVALAALLALREQREEAAA